MDARKSHSAQTQTARRKQHPTSHFDSIASAISFIEGLYFSEKFVKTVPALGFLVSPFSDFASKILNEESLCQIS